MNERKQKAAVKQWMLLNAKHHDNATSLAEDAAHNALENDHDEWLDDESHWVWDLAIEIVPNK